MGAIGDSATHRVLERNLAEQQETNRHLMRLVEEVTTTNSLLRDLIAICENAEDPLDKEIRNAQ